MRIVRGDGSDRATTQACFEVVRAACAVDDPLGPPWSLRRLRGWLEHPTDPNEAVDRRRRGGRGGCLGWYYLVLPERENRDRAHF